MSNMADLKLPDVRALVAFGKVGVELIASRMLSLIALVGVLALSGYVVYAPPTWQGIAAIAVVALLVFMPALKAESGRRQEPPAQGD